MLTFLVLPRRAADSPTPVWITQVLMECPPWKAPTILSENIGHPFDLAPVEFGKADILRGPWAFAAAVGPRPHGASLCSMVGDTSTYWTSDRTNPVFLSGNGVIAATLDFASVAGCPPHYVPNSPLVSRDGAIPIAFTSWSRSILDNAVL